MSAGEELMVFVAVTQLERLFSRRRGAVSLRPLRARLCWPAERPYQPVSVAENESALTLGSLRSLL